MLERNSVVMEKLRGAVESGSLKGAGEALSNPKIEVNTIKTKDGVTLLQRAVLVGYPPMVRLLVHHGADIKQAFEELPEIAFLGDKKTAIGIASSLGEGFNEVVNTVKELQSFKRLLNSFAVENRDGPRGLCFKIIQRGLAHLSEEEGSQLLNDEWAEADFCERTIIPLSEYDKLPKSERDGVFPQDKGFAIKFVHSVVPYTLLDLRSSQLSGDPPVVEKLGKALLRELGELEWMCPRGGAEAGEKKWCGEARSAGDVMTR